MCLEGICLTYGVSQLFLFFWSWWLCLNLTARRIDNYLNRICKAYCPVHRPDSVVLSGGSRAFKGSLRAVRIDPC